MLLENKIAIVTGAASGMGRAIAEGMAAQGAHVVVADINAPAVEDAVRSIKANGGTASGRVVDIANRNDCHTLVDTVVDEFGQLDVLVNSAGVGQVKLLNEVTESDWDRIMGINARGLFFLSQAAMAAMRQRRSGRIINLASIAGRRGEALVAPYCASKAAVISLTQSFSEEGAPDGVTVNALAPGIVDTPYWKQSDLEFARIFGKAPGEHFAETIKKIPLGRAQQAHDVVPLAVFLAGEGGNYITGQTYNVDGGITLS